MTTTVAAGVSRLSLLNLTENSVSDQKFILEIYDGDDRIQVEFQDREHFLEVVDQDPQKMIGYFENNLFDSPDMSDPFKAMVRMAHTAAEEGLVTVPMEEDDEELTDIMTSIFQKAVNLEEATTSQAEQAGDNMVQNMLREEQDE